MRIYFISVFLLFNLAVVGQTGKYAGTKKSLIGKTYSDDRNIPGLKGFMYVEGSLITPIDDPEAMTAGVYKKGTTYVVIFGYKEDTAATRFEIADVLEVKGVLSTQTIRSGTCSDGPNEAADVVALIKNENTDSSKAIKAWRLNRDKKRIELAQAKLIKCLNEGGD